MPNSANNNNNNVSGCCILTPVAILEGDLNASGQLVGIRNISQYNDKVGQPTLTRQAEWFIFVNHRLVYGFGQGYLNTPLSIGGDRAYMSLTNGAATVIAFLANIGIQVNLGDRLEIAATVVNVSRYRSLLSNKILLSADAKDFDCCDDSDGYQLQIDGALFCFADYEGNCYTPQ
jgi:hypothetical protein